MSSMTVTVSGHLGNHPDLRQTASGTKWVRFSLACNTSYRDQNGNWTTGDTTWFNCKAWGAFAVNISASLHKGDPVVAQGRLVPGVYEYQDKTTGVIEKRPELALHLTHIGVDLLRATSINVKHVGESLEPKLAEKKFDIPASTTNQTSYDSSKEKDAESPELVEISDELVEEIEEAESDSLVAAGSEGVPF